MSSESDDDFSYTNSVSVLKNFKKKEISISDKDDSANSDLALFETPEPVKPKSRRTIRTRAALALKSTSDLNVEPIIEINDDPVSNDTEIACIILSEDEQNTSLNIISTIDNYLNKGKSKKGRGKGRKVTKRVTRNSLKAVAALEQDAPIQITGLYTIEDSDSDDAVADVNYEVSVKVWWKSQYVEKFTIRRFERMNLIFEHFADKENVPKDRLLFTIRDRFVLPTDSPDTLNVNAATIIEGGVLSEKSNYTQCHQSTSHDDDDYVELKVQMNNRKHPLLISIKTTDTMNVFMCKCAEELQVLLTDLTFFFDGHLIKNHDTPIKLELEGGECIDCVQK